jgi:disease resistance protein RPM1
MKKVLKDILYELDKSKYADIHNAKRDERQLIDVLSDFLTNKRYMRYFFPVNNHWYFFAKKNH